MPVRPQPRLALPAPRPGDPLSVPGRRRSATLQLKRKKSIITALADAGLELEAELILRGRVKPGKRVRIANRIIHTHPDGSFCVSCVIRNGRIHVPVEVVEGELVTARQSFELSLGGPVPGSDA